MSNMDSSLKICFDVISFWLFSFTCYHFILKTVKTSLTASTYTNPSEIKDPSLPLEDKNPPQHLFKHILSKKCF